MFDEVCATLRVKGRTPPDDWIGRGSPGCEDSSLGVEEGVPIPFPGSNPKLSREGNSIQFTQTTYTVGWKLVVENLQPDDELNVPFVLVPVAFHPVVP